MTEIDEVKIRPEDVAAFWHGYNSAFTSDKDERVKLGLQHAIAARVPDADHDAPEDSHAAGEQHGANRFRDAVLRGPQK